MSRVTPCALNETFEEVWRKSGNFSGGAYEAESAETKQTAIYEKWMADRGEQEDFLSDAELLPLAIAHNGLYCCCPFLMSQPDFSGDRGHETENLLIDLSWDVKPTMHHVGDTMPEVRYVIRTN